MAYEIDYTTIADEFKRREQALKDLKNWLGPTTYKKASKLALEHKNEPNAREQLAISMSLFQGISGLPVEVWLDSLGIYPSTPITLSGSAETQATEPV